MTNTVTISVEAYNKLVNERNTYKESWEVTKDALNDNADREAMEGEASLAYDTIDRLNRQYIELEDLYAELIDELSGKDERIKTLANNLATATHVTRAYVQRYQELRKSVDTLNEELADAHAKNDVLEAVVEFCEPLRAPHSCTCDCESCHHCTNFPRY